MTTALHLGATPWRRPDAGQAQVLIAQASLVERLGYQSFWLPESHFVRHARPAPLLELATIAAATATLRLGTTSYLLPIRHPLLAAEEVAVLDRLSGGRLILGIGRGFRPELFEGFGVAAREKRLRFEKALDTMRSLWAGNPIEGGSSGSSTLQPTPCQRPHPPLWVAAFGEKALQQVARLGLPYLASPLESLEELKTNWQRLRSLSDGYGDQPVPVMRTVFVAEKKAHLDAALDALERERKQWQNAPSARVRRASETPLEDRVLHGTPEVVRQQLWRYRESIGLTHLIARGGIPGVEDALLEESLGILREIC